MAEDQRPGREDISELRERIQLLEERVAQIERGQVPALQPEPSAAPRVRSPRPDADLTVATALTRVAMLSFVLLGALLLRTLTQQKILGVGFGTLLGFTYAGHLIVLSFLPGRLGALARATSLFQCCGVVLAFFIALESSLRAHTLTRPTAMILEAGFVALALGVATMHRKASLAGTALVGGMMALVALGLEAEGLTLQLSLLVVFVVAAAVLAWRCAWAFLRPLTFPLLMMALPVGCLLASKESLGRGPLYACATAFWLVIVLQHLLTLRRLGAAAAWLPLSTGWLAALAWMESWPALASMAAGVSAVATLITVVAVRASRVSTGGVTGMAATAVVAGAIGWPTLDPSGVLCALAGVALWATARRSRSNLPWGTGSAVILMMAATIRGVFHLLRSGPLPYPLVTGVLLAAILLIHFLRTDPSRTAAPSGLAQGAASLILAAGLLVLFAVFRGIALSLLADPASFQLAQTVILTAAAVLLTLCGHAGHRRAVVYSGLACMFLSLLKVGLVDLGRLSGIHLLASTVLLGLSSVGVSVILRRRD